MENSIKEFKNYLVCDLNLGHQYIYLELLYNVVEII